MADVGLWFCFGILSFVFHSSQDKWAIHAARSTEITLRTNQFDFASA